MKKTLFRKPYRSGMMSMKDIKTYLLSQYKKRLSPNRRFFCFLILLVFFMPLRAQVRHYTDSFKEKRSFYFTWDSKITFITNRYAQVKSIKCGFDFGGGKTKFGIGYNWYKGPIVRTFDGPEGSTLTANFKFRYASIFTEYLYFKNDKWEATIPAQVGVGIMQYNQEFTKNRIPGAGGVFLVYEPASTITYRFLRYFGIGVGLGYRLVIMLGDNPQNEQLHSPVIMLRSKLYFDTLLADFKGWRKKKKK